MSTKHAYKPICQDDNDNDNFDLKEKAVNKPSRRKYYVIVIGTIVVILAVVIFLIVFLSKRSTKDATKDNIYSLPVSTNCGPVIGIKVKASNNKEVYTFKGIPYAEPPIGSLRWKAPKPSSCWNDTLKATKFKSQCVQSMEPIQGLEDCLYLNIWTPSLSNTSNLPVFVWIHGGYLMTGNGNMPGYAPDAEFVTSMNVVAVSMNYRLNAFGFLTLKELWEEGESYGNYGIMDQILVLKWIKNNIRNFGGNPDSVTVAGQSSGGTSIFGLLASPPAVGLFHKAIPMSSSPTFNRDYIKASEDNKVFVKKTKCQNILTSENLKTCLLNLTKEEVTNAIPLDEYPFWGMDDLLDFPQKGSLDGSLIVTDPIIITVSPHNISAIKVVTNVSVLTGNTAQEVGFGSSQQFNGDNSWHSFNQYFNKTLAKFSPDFYKTFKNLYNQSVFKNMDAQCLYETVTTDVRVTCPLNQLSKEFSQTPNHLSYRYIIQYKPYKSIVLKPNTSSHNAFHAWDSIALFGFKMVQPSGYKPSKTDFVYMQTIQSVFKEFIVSGKLDKFQWKPGATGVLIDDGTLKVWTGDYHNKQCLFWNDPNNGFTAYAWIN